MRTVLLLLAGLTGAAASTGLTIYNQNFAVVRDTIPLDLPAGLSEFHYERASAQLEPDSVILRDADGVPLPVIEQGYRNDPLGEALLLSLFEGQTLDFYQREPNKPDRIVPGRIIRSGYQPGGVSASPVIEVDGKIQFSLPGEPRFPSLGNQTVLKPRLTWRLQNAHPLRTTATLGYLTSGLSWEASYNLVLTEQGNSLDVVGWITMENRSGTTYEDATIKLLAGDVRKLPRSQGLRDEEGPMRFRMTAAIAAEPAVTEKAFDEYHLYSLARPTTLRDQETKQVEFLRASDVYCDTVYVYDALHGSAGSWMQHGLSSPLLEREAGLESGTKVAVVREFENTKQNRLGIPLPRGRVRFYREDGTSLEFTGENQIDHTPADETVKIPTGHAFDLVGEHKRVGFAIDTSNNRIEESFEITLRNRKTSAVTIRVVEHLFRWSNWSLPVKSQDFTKTSANTIEFQVPVNAGGESRLSYTVVYTW